MKTESEIQDKITELLQIEFMSSSHLVRNRAHVAAKILCWTIENEKGTAVEDNVEKFIHNFS